MSDLISYATMLEDNRLRDARIAALENPSATSDQKPDILYFCNGCWGGSARIPTAARGVYSRYEIFGQTGCWNQYCSQATFQFAASQAAGAADTLAAYCCVNAACGSIGDFKCFSATEVYTCAGAIPWPFGCSSGCATACSDQGFHFHASVIPRNACCTDNNEGSCFHYCFATTVNGQGAFCCYGVKNRGMAINCCCASSACLIGLCFSTPSGTNAFAAATNVIIVGYGKITPS